MTNASLESYFAGAYWGPRRESPNDCAERAHSFLDALAEISGLFSGWRPVALSRAAATRARPLDIGSIDQLSKLFELGSNRKDIGGEVIDELGFRLAVWNGGKDMSAVSLSMKCGMYSTVAGLSNAVVLKLPQQFDVCSKEKIRDLLRAFAQAWEPDWAIITSQSARSRQADHSPYLDRGLYIRNSTPAPHGLPASATRHMLAGGILYVA